MSRGHVDAGVPVTMFEGRFVSGTVTLANYDVAADGQSFFMVQEDVTPAPTAVCVTMDGTRGGLLDTPREPSQAVELVRQGREDRTQQIERVFEQSRASHARRR